MENKDKSVLLRSAIEATEIVVREGVMKQQELKLSLREKDMEQYELEK